MTASPPISEPSAFSGAARRAIETLRRALQWIPSKARFATCLGLFVLITLAIYSYATSGSSTLNLVCRHNLQSADLSVFVDGKPVFADRVSGSVKRRFGFLDKKVEGTLSKVLAIQPGRHDVKVELKSSPERFDQARQIAVNLVSGREATVVITAQRGELTLAFQGVPADSDQVGQPAYSGSIRSILFTVLGSVASAAIGFIVQEFLRTRKEAFTQNQNSKLAR
jgi:hypothetical protein